jgi:hypothetical protein
MSQESQNCHFLYSAISPNQPKFKFIKQSLYVLTENHNLLNERFKFDSEDGNTSSMTSNIKQHQETYGRSCIFIPDNTSVISVNSILEKINCLISTRALSDMSHYLKSKERNAANWIHMRLEPLLLYMQDLQMPSSAPFTTHVFFLDFATRIQQTVLLSNIQTGHRLCSFNISYQSMYKQC